MYKNEHKYKDLSKEELVKKIEKLESRKKYGLVWDEEKTKEKFEKDAENALPVLKEIKSKEIKTGKEDTINVLIEGDNYHSLSVLNFTHQRRVDVIYIDPPYNTGKEFIYNDKKIEKEDSYRHSKWLSFMNKRLRLARNLLSEKGVIFISIDENEQAQLKLLLDEIFLPENFIANITVQSNPRGKQQMKIATTHEYLLVYGKNINKAQINSEELSDEQVGGYSKIDKNNFNYRELGLRKRGAASRRVDVPNLYYPIYVNSKTGEVALKKDKIFTKESLPILSNGEDGRWRWGKKKFEIDKNRLYGRLVNNERWDIFERDYLIKDGEQKGIKSKSIWDEKELNYENAKKELKDLFDGKTLFDFPKTVYLIKKICKIASNSNSIILDFFAGSGTTGQAVLRLNEEDGGNRQFILCTNNESNICSNVCYPRIMKVIKGYKDLKGQKVDGLCGNLKFFKTAFVKNSVNRDEMKIKITGECTEMLCLREGIFDEIKNTKSYKIFKQEDKIMAIYYSLERNKIDDLKKFLDKMSGDKILYCFTLDHLGLNENDFIGWNDVRLEPIPQKILDIYKNIYEY